MGDTIGMIETRGFVGLVQAVDSMLKTAEVELIGYERIGGGYVTAIVRGAEEAVRVATEAGAQEAERIGELISVHVLPQPHPDLNKALPLP